MNISNPDRLAADSGWLFADLLAPALADRDFEVTIGGPSPVGDSRALHAAVPAQGTKYRARFTNDVGRLSSLIDNVKPDVVVANQIENAPAIRAAIVESGSSALLAGYCHYLPFYGDHKGIHLDPSLSDGGLGNAVLLTFFSGLSICDRIMVHSTVAAEWVTALAPRFGLDLSDRLRIVPPPRDPRLVRTHIERPEKPIGIYNHRLYEHYGTGRFVALARQVTAATPAAIRVMDLFGARRAGRASLDSSPDRYRAALAGLPRTEVVSDHGERNLYRSNLAGSLFGFAPFRPSCPWSMSVIDCQGMGLPVIAPRMGWMERHISTDLLFDSPAAAVDIVRRLIADAGFWAAQSDTARESTSLLTPDRVADLYTEALS
ncbi:hypothetical protein Ga0074812_1711 [Parafrankia irregularis]|uniref:Uncharacterized protein n=2 Tax=Parafrankia irregularis TaxID=795642 RepID=A0A0S4R263_9ACTN|nr:vegetative cell wall protein [Parafrankia sp. CH37]CUU61266.1 hypothetical protein Ga0074812_1711 [Parafrankia irregularis]MBE3206614.1 glycosyltransferase family 1 protein [Parafrankia sp. CH37]MBE3206620.1 glycosyltransferase family 1 protein [Parafrankia sp. CH37]MBE3206626.1 glycosyltransferase family 1 protein [Parafrankia sp. CH37]MBE3206736.1 glycosyltransferase family 1 protein [Parafrankia sp. CH37]